MKTLVIALLVAALAACGKSKDKPAPPEPGSASAVVAGSAQAGSAQVNPDAAPAEDDVDIPTAMDYEDLAAEEVTEQTVEARLRALEGQLAE